MTSSSKATRFFFLAGALSCGLAWAVPANSPSLDPTYGLPVPAIQTSAAQWIWAANTTENQVVWLRRDFDLKTAPQKARIYITADDFFSFWINGKEVTSTTPDPTDNYLWQHIRNIDVSSFLRAGHNVMAVQVTNKASAAGMVARLEIPGQAPLESDTNWKVVTSEPAADWTDATFDDNAWAPATAIAPVTGGLWGANGGLPDWPTSVMAHLTLPFVAVTEAKPGLGKIEGANGYTGDKNAIFTVTPAPPGDQNAPSILLDFGKEIAGRVTIQALSGGTVLVGTGESREEALQSPWHGQANLALQAGKPVSSPYSAFRYARLVFPCAPDGTPTPVRFSVAVDHKYYPVEYKGSFDCSDPLLTKIWWTGAYTAHLCMQEDIWDAPKRDRAKWIGDLHVSGEIINNVFGDKFLMEQTISRLREEAQGGRPDTDLPGNHVNGIPGYSAAWVCTLADFYRHEGDSAFLAKEHQPLVSLLEYMKGEFDERGVFVNKLGKWPFTDWSPDFNHDSPQARLGTHLFFAKAAQEGAYLLREMGDTANADKTAAWADKLAAAAKQYLADNATNTYGNRLQSNAMAIYSGVATPAQSAAIYSTVLNPDSPSWNKTGALLGNAPVMSPYYGNYIIYAMSETGHNADTMRVLRDYWGGMLAEGATTMWEAYDTKWQKDNFHAFLQADDSTGYFVSLCHGWSAGPTNWLTERVLGVRSTGAGFKTAVIAPDLGDLQWAEGNVPTPTGTIHVRAENKGGKLGLDVTVPAGTTADVSLPGTGLKVNGNTPKTTRVEAGRTITTLSAGKYSVST